MRTMRSEYSSASCGLCVTMMTRRSRLSSFRNFHDLNGGFGVEGAGGLVGQDDLGVVHDGARDGHALHLTAGELVRPLFQVFSQTHAGKRFLRAMPALGLRVPESNSAISTFASTVWCGMRL